MAVENAIEANFDRQIHDTLDLRNAAVVENTIKGNFDRQIHGTLVSRARLLRPLLERYAPLHEQTGELSQEVVDALDQAELLKMAGPRRWGGLCTTSRAMADVSRELAKGCPSTAWVVSILNSNFWLASTMAPAMQRIIFTDGIPRITGPTNGMGLISNENGQLVVSGTWAYGSASHHSKWALVPAKDDKGTVNMVALPMKDVRMVNTWNVAGMKGTGSDSITADRVEIMAAQMCEIAAYGTGVAAAAGEGFPREPTDYHVGFTLLRAKALGVMIGAAEGLLEAVTATKSRALIFSNYTHKSDSEVFQHGVGESAAKIRAARTIMDRATALCDDSADRGHVLTYAERAESKGEVAVAAELLIYAVEKLMSLGGSSSYGTANTAQRYWRDFSIGIRHVIFNVELGYQVYGRQLMGIEPNVVHADHV